MNKLNLFKKIAALVLVLSVLFLCSCSTDTPNSDENESATVFETYKNGDKLLFGTYPQTEVEESLVVVELNKLINPDRWVSYGYNVAQYDYGSIPCCSKESKSSDICYQDVEYNGDKYRAVRFETYRATWAECPTDDFHDAYYFGTVNKSLGSNKTYWFKYEPIEWIILDIDKGLMVTNLVIDSQPFVEHIYFSDKIHPNSYADEYYGDLEHTYLANNYENSFIRHWLNSKFISTAFSTEETSTIKETEVDNSVITDPEYKGNEKYFCNNTIDKAFLLSYTEVSDNQYGLLMSDGTVNTAREAQYTDYAKYQGVSTDTNNSIWMLRTPGTIRSVEVCFVNSYGNVSTYAGGEWKTANSVELGVRPAICIDTSIVAPATSNTQMAE